MQNHSTDTGLTIGALAERTGLTVPTIRYYEQIGLVPPAKRRPSGHRFYDRDAEQLLSFVRHCRDFGFPIEQVRELVSLSKSEVRDCFETREIAQAHLETVRTRLAELRALERSLASFVKSCSDVCAGGPATQCTIQQDISSGASAARPVKTGCCG